MVSTFNFGSGRAVTSSVLVGGKRLQNRHDTNQFCDRTFFNRRGNNIPSFCQKFGGTGDTRELGIISHPHNDAGCGSWYAGGGCIRPVRPE